MVKELTGSGFVWIADQQCDGNRGTTTGSEDLAAFHAGGFPRSALIATKVETVNGGELVIKTLPQAIHCVVVDKGSVGDKGNNAPLLNTIACPANAANIGVI